MPLKPPSIETQITQRAVHLLEYWRTIWDNRWTVAAIWVTVLLIAGLGTFLQKPVYKSTATVNIEARSKRISPVAEVVSPGLSDYSWFSEERYFNTQFQIIKSRSVAERVFEQLAFDDGSRFVNEPDPISAFIRLVEVEPLQGTGIVKVSISGTDPKQITNWVNAVVESYVRRNLDVAIDATRKAINSLLNEMEPLRDRLLRTDEARFDYAEKSSLYVPQDQQETLDERVRKLVSQQTQARITRLELEAVFRKIEELSRSDESFLHIPEVSSDPTIRKMNEESIRLEKDLNRLLVSFKGSHPRVVEKRSEIDNISARIDQESKQIINSIRTKYQLNRDREIYLAREIEKTKSESLKTRQKTSSYQLLASDASDTRRLFDLFSARVKEINLNADLLNNNIRVLDRAVVPKIPIRPRKALNILVGCILGLGLGIGTAFVLEYLDHTVKSTEELEEFLGISALAVVPRKTDGTHNAMRESFQTLRTSLLFSSKNRADRVLLITSTGPREGKTSTTVELARTCAAAGDSVCVVDGDLRRPTLHTHLGVHRHHGLTNYLMCSDEASWRDYVKASNISKVDAITSGAIPPNPPQVFGNDRFIRLIQTLKDEYDWVFVDSPPIGSLTDSMILASIVDMVALVIRYQRTDRDVIKRAVDNLNNMKANLIGGILNDIDPERSHFKSYYDYSYYLDGDTAGRKEGDSEERDLEQAETPAV